MVAALGIWLVKTSEGLIDPVARKEPTIEYVPISRIFLNWENPRHEPFEADSQVIEYLCREEMVYQLAKDMVEIEGVNPLELPALLPSGKETKRKSSQNYFVAEGNRRMCALKLLHDPELAPPDLRKKFHALSKGWNGPTDLLSAVFDDMDDVRPWLSRIHNGLQGGIGRKPWTPDQQGRFSGDRKNQAALRLIDYAETKGMISAEDRKGKLTTAQRYLGNPLFREALGIDTSSPDNISVNRVREEFDILVEKFVKDLTGPKPKVNSRARKTDIDQYSRELTAVDGVSRDRVDPVAIDAIEKPKRRTRKKKPTKPAKRKHVEYEEAIDNKLRSNGANKLSSLYYSICAVDLDPHTPLISVGTWSFLESLTSLMGRADGESFESFLNKQRLQNLGLGTGPKTKALREAVGRLAENGNTTKHHHTAANFNGDQLANDMDTLKDLILICIDAAASKRS